MKGRSSHGRKSFHHPEVGDLTLGYQGMELDGTPGHRLIVYYAEPGTPDHDALVLLDMTAAQHTAKPPAEQPSASSRADGARARVFSAVRTDWLSSGPR